MWNLRFEDRLACSRFAQVPLCNLGRDALTTMTDVLFGRTLQVCMCGGRGEGGVCVCVCVCVWCVCRGEGCVSVGVWYCLSICVPTLKPINFFQPPSLPQSLLTSLPPSIPPYLRPSLHPSISPSLPLTPSLLLSISLFPGLTPYSSQSNRHLLWSTESEVPDLGGAETDKQGYEKSSFN